MDPGARVQPSGNPIRPHWQGSCVCPTLHGSVKENCRKRPTTFPSATKTPYKICEGHLTSRQLFRYCWCLPQHPPLSVKSSPSIFHSCPVPEISFQHLTALCNSSMASSKPIVLHIGDPVKWNTELFAKFSKDFTVIRPSTEERQRDEFKKALREKRWGDFSAIFRPFWNTGGEMGNWDKELIPLLPASCKVFASAGAGFDWVHVDLLAARGMHFHLFSGIQS